MRYPPQHKQHTRERILRAAARQFRERGFEEPTVASIMREADLTHGGFYAHFQSKDELVGDVIRGGFDRVSERFEAAFDHLDDERWLGEWVAAYLSEEHELHPGEGCPMPALASEIARSGPSARSAFTALFRDRLERVKAKVDAPDAAADSRVLAAISQMTGALMLARALDEPLSSAIRHAAREAALATLLGRPRASDGGEA